MVKVGLCAGVFDCLHKGHLNFFEKAKEHCNFLIVAIASDWATRIQKGHDRPHYSAEKREFDVKQSGYADMTIVTDLVDVTDLLIENDVDVLIRGEEQLNLRPKKWNEVIYVPYTKGISTTEIINEK